MRICGPSGAAGGPTYGEGNGEGEALAVAAGAGDGEPDDAGEGEGDSALCATCFAGAACVIGVPHPFCSSESACAVSSSSLAAGAGTTVHSANESATKVTPVRRSTFLIGSRASREPRRRLR
jgi:hypothetical protein